jgi:nucleoside-diphosphate-sugar epimerase
MRVVVIGATGNAGTALLRALVDEPAVHEIVGVARRRPRSAAPKTTFQVADVSRDALAPCCARRRSGAPGLAHPALAGRAVYQGHERRWQPARFQAVAEAGVPRLVYAVLGRGVPSGPKDRRVGEDWPATGIPSSFYSRHKAAVEGQIARFTREHPEIRVAWCGPALIFQRDAASGIRRLFAGPFLPSPLLRRNLVRVCPTTGGCGSRPSTPTTWPTPTGARSWTTTPAGPTTSRPAVLDGPAFRALARGRPGARPRAGAARRRVADLAGAPAAHAARLGRHGLGVPLMDVSRARDQLGWAPRHSADQAFLELFDGMRERAGAERRAASACRRTSRACASCSPASAAAAAERKTLLPRRSRVGWSWTTSRETMAQDHFDRLTAVDASFLHQEGPVSHMHVAPSRSSRGRPAVRGVLWTACASACTSCLAIASTLSSRRWRPAGPVGRRPDFNLEYHVRQTALPARAPRSSCAAGARDHLPAARPLQAAVGACGIVEGLRRAAASRSSPRPTTR